MKHFNNDHVAMNQIKMLLPKGFSFLAINQDAKKILLKDIKGKLVIYKYNFANFTWLCTETKKWNNKFKYYMVTKDIGKGKAKGEIIGNSLDILFNCDESTWFV